VLPRVSNRLKFAAGALLAAIIITPASAEIDELGRPPIRDFRPTEYRGHPQVHRVIQGANGFIYLANQEGVVEFDGVRWHHLPAPSSMIYEMAVTPDGRLWIGGNDELGYFTPQAGGGWRYTSLRERLPAPLRPWGRTSQMLALGDAVYASSARGVVRFAGAGDRLDCWPHARPTSTNLHQVGDEIVAHVAARGLLRLAPGGDLTPYCNTAPLTDTVRAASSPLPDGRVFFAVSQGGAFALEPRTRELTRLSGPLDTLLRTVRVYDAEPLRDGRIALATSSQGLVLAQADLRAYRRLDRSDGLADNAVLSLARDREDGLWLGLNSGAARLALRSAVSIFDATNGPTPGTVDCWGRHAGRLYAGTFDGLYLLEPADGDTGRGARFTRVNDQIAHVFGIESWENQLLVAAGGGLYAIDAQHRATLLAATPNNSPFALVRSARFPGRFYLPGQNGLSVVERIDGVWRTRTERPDLGDVHTAVLDADGSLWLATYSRGFWRATGIDRLPDPATASYEQYASGHGLPDDIVWTTVTPGVGGPVFFTDKGQRRFDPARGEFVAESRHAIPGEGEILLTPTIVSGRETWASVFRAGSTIAAAFPLGRFAPAGWRSAPAEALGEISFSGAAVMWIDDLPTGPVLWARGYGNIIRLDLTRAAVADAPWSATVRAIEAEGHAVPLPAPNATLSLRYSREPITVELAAPRFAALDGVRFQTRLIGFADRWTEPAAEPRVRFTNLEGGPFTLEARAVDATGAVSEVARLTFTVAPPWQRSPAAYTLYALLALAAVAGFVRWRLAAARREQARLERLVQQRTVELARARDDADSANRAKSTFLAQMSHELRTPLNGIIGYAQVLLKDAAVTGRQRERVNIVHTSGQHLLRLINEVLDFSKIEAGKIERRDAPFHLEQLLRELSVAHEAAAHARGLAYAIELPSPAPARVVGDAQKLRQILDNLLSNAVKFTRDGSVTLRLERLAGDDWRFTVADTGVGLGPEDRARLFQPFEQARHDRPAAPGTGLGLAITHRLVQLLGGDLAVDSAPGAGSRFTFSLTLPPAHTPADASQSAAPFASYAGPRRRVIVVDDTALNRSLVADLLTPVGFEVNDYGSAEELLALPDGEIAADLLLLDVKLPGLDGLELARRLRVRTDTARVPIVFSSAAVLTFDRAAAAAVGSHEFLPKPFAAAQLHELLTRTLSLEWQPVAAPAQAGQGTPANAPAAPLPETLLATLRTLADSGDVAALREAVATARREHPTAPLLVELESALASYQVERARQLLNRH